MLENIPGIGPKTLKVLQKLEIETTYDLINYYPFRYQIYTITDLRNAAYDEIVTVKGIIEALPKIAYIKKNFNRVSFRMIINNLLINVVIFNRAFIKNNLNVGRAIVLIGKYDKNKNIFTASDIKFDNFDKEKIESIYHVTEGISSKKINQFINNALKKYPDVIDNIPAYIANQFDFISKKEALGFIHNPSNLQEVKKAKLRLIYEELFEFTFKINYLKIKRKLLENAFIKSYDEKKLNGFINSLPFKLTDDQEKATLEILDDFVSARSLNRLVLGDVGSGKTVVAINAIYANYLSGYQSVLMAPTEILAIQHFNSISNLLKSTDMKIAILTSSTKKKEKDIIYEKIKNKEIDLLVGTHSVLNECLEFNNLGLVITDEQHRFGVKQRNILHQKAVDCDVLYLSATPIPRTYALTLFGDMDISIIKTKPAGRREIKTKVFNYGEIKDVLLKMLEEIKKGHQVFVVCPLIENDDGESDLTSVTLLKDKMNMAFQDKVPIDIIHGKIKSKDKDIIMEKFKNNETKVLISTTVIEVGIDIKNATMMVIFDANRFGLATLHQLRGRVGRNDYDCFCYLVSKSETKRLKIMEESNDGFYISEKDFELRGSGDIFGTSQSGDMTFKLANIQNDYKILVQTQKDSEEYLLSEKYLENDYFVNIINNINWID